MFASNQCEWLSGEDSPGLVKLGSGQGVFALLQCLGLVSSNIFINNLDENKLIMEIRE